MIRKQLLDALLKKSSTSYKGYTYSESLVKKYLISFNTSLTEVGKSFFYFCD